MTHREMLAELDALAKRINSEPVTRRHLLQPEFHRLVERMVEAGIPLTEQVKRLDDMLTDAAIEAQFDNLPL